jgi:hypothetical protein
VRALEPEKVAEKVREMAKVMAAEVVVALALA